MKLLVSLILASVIRLGLGSGRSAAWPKVIFVPVRQTNTDRSGCLMLLLLAVVGLLVGQLLLASFGR